MKLVSRILQLEEKLAQPSASKIYFGMSEKELRGKAERALECFGFLFDKDVRDEEFWEIVRILSVNFPEIKRDRNNPIIIKSKDDLVYFSNLMLK